jgi:serine/threonine protein kinase
MVFSLSFHTSTFLSLLSWDTNQIQPKYSIILWPSYRLRNNFGQVRLIGYCVEGSLFLVYEFIENGNLGQHLRGNSGKDPLPWSTRVQVALDSARGLEYIHEHTVPVYIHRDVKSANILIDKNFRGKVRNLPVFLYMIASEVFLCEVLQTNILYRLRILVWQGLLKLEVLHCTHALSVHLDTCLQSKFSHCKRFQNLSQDRIMSFFFPL